MLDWTILNAIDELGTMIRANAKPVKSREEFLALHDRIRAEYINGQLLTLPSPKHRHQRVVQRLLRVLGHYVESNDLGSIELSPLDAHLPSGDVVQPDLMFISNKKQHIIKDWVLGVPDLVIEVISQTPRRDRIIKRELYSRNGILEYWIVDDLNFRIELLTLEGEHYRTVGDYGPRERLTSPLLNKLSIPLSQIFR